MTTTNGDEAVVLQRLLSAQASVLEAIEANSPADVAEGRFDEFHAALLEAGPIISRQLAHAHEDFADAVANQYLALSEVIARLLFGVARLNTLLGDDDAAKP